MNNYPPRHHQSNDKQKMIAIIKQYPLAMLVSALNGKPLITHIPIIYNDTTGKLVAHIDKFNPQVASLKNGGEVTVVFKGPDSYISPVFIPQNNCLLGIILLFILKEPLL